MNNNIVNNRIYNKIQHDIRNNKKLTIEQIDFINALTNDEKMEIILLYDKVMEASKKLLDELLDTTSFR
jgi:vacuolar-type H+-ATPase subunit F/Vma7